LEHSTTMQKLLVLTLYVGATFADEDAASMLQMQILHKQTVETGALVTLKSKFLEFSEANASTRCSCHWNGCAVFACMPCPLIMCQCPCAFERVQCRPCCGGDEVCIKNKLVGVGNRKLKKAVALEKYRIASAQYRRDMEIQDRDGEDQEWKFDKVMRQHILKVRGDKDKIWSKTTDEHKRLKTARKLRNKFFMKWKKDLSDEVANVKRLLAGGRTQHSFDIINPICDCPPAPRCPPPPGCPRCPPARCPPCKPCTGSGNTCEKCDEDEGIDDAVNKMMAQKDFVVCPPLGSYCESKGTWPQGCPAPKTTCPPGPASCICPKIFSPVCDSTGKRYANACEADCEGAVPQPCP